MRGGMFGEVRDGGLPWEWPAAEPDDTWIFDL
jgi:hypothetical protein